VLFFYYPPTTTIYPLSLHDALPISLRRFTFKIQFRPLRPEQRERMFVVEALGGDEAALTESIRARLAKLDQLCPGDFAAVQRQRSEEHTSELQSRENLVCRLLLEKK